MKTRTWLVSGLLIGAMNLSAAVIPVMSVADNGPGSMRAALATASNGDTIDASGVSGTILLTSGELLVSNSVTILGPGPANLAVDGNFASRVFHIAQSNVVAIANLNITDGDVASYGGGIGADYAVVLAVSNCWVLGSTAYSGGGIFFGGTMLILVDTIVFGNSANNGGGLVVNQGTLAITDCTIKFNSCVGTYYDGGGGIENAQGKVMMINSTVSSNGATAGAGGGINNFGGTVTILNSTINDNGAYFDGSAIANDSADGISAVLVVSNSTLSANGSTYGGVIGNEPFGGTAKVGVVNCTISDSGGIYNFGILEIGNTILKPAGLANSGTVTSLGYNLSSDAAGGDGSTGPGGLLNATGDIRNTDPMLGPLQNNGGPTLTHALLPGSPAIDAGDPNFVPPPSYDQRGPGFPRVLANWSGSPRIDIGAYEAIPTFTVSDGVPDSWRAHFFANQPPGNSNGTATNGQSCAACDADGTGQNNLFKYVAGLNPTNPASLFALNIANVSGQPNQKNLIFNPEVSGRTYTPQFRTNLTSGSWAALASAGGPVTNANQLAVTDTNAVEPQKFYRIDISLP
ncbi:MAG TPA: choice-of-anchor Q domain-containing protein [Verrucomicrobiae bacterium]|nr:choice-of-anchor Q domain-containing protein [Verrucomicrobiae bacterium]